MDMPDAKHMRIARHIERQAHETYGPGLPTWCGCCIYATALSQCETSAKPSLQAACAVLATSAKCSVLEDVVQRLLGQRGLAWERAEDRLDDLRLKVISRLILAKLKEPAATFELFPPDVLLAAVDEYGAVQEFNVGGSSLPKTVAQLASGGSRRLLAPLPSMEDLGEVAVQMPNFAEVVQFYVGQTALLRLRGVAAALFPPVLLVGPPGLGKTLFAHRLAGVIQSPCRVVSMASQTAGWAITGLDPSWGGAKSGIVFNTLSASRQANPVLMLDEVDKTSGSERFAVLGGLYALLERDTARNFIDEYVGIPINAEAIIWVLTANDQEEIPAPLLSRLTVFTIESPDSAQARNIVRSQFDRIRGAARFAPLAEAVVDELVELPPRQMGVRLQVAIGRAAQRAVSAGEDEACVLVQDLPGRPNGHVQRVGFL